jgi:hypothetical protein
MILELTPSELSSLKDLIFDKIDQVGGLIELPDNIYKILMKITSEKAPEVL